MAQVLTRGIEAEGWALDTHRNLVDVEPLLSKYSKDARGEFATEPGFGALEVVGAPATLLEEAVEHIIVKTRELESQEGLRVIYCNRRPVPVVSEEHLNTSRYRALWAATWQEAQAHGYSFAQWEILQLMRERAALQISFSVTGMPVTKDIIDGRMLFAMNVLNLVGPRLSKLLLAASDMPHGDFLSIWNGWANPGRFMYESKWFPTFNDMQCHFESLKRLIVCVKEHPVDSKKYGTWTPDLVNPLQWGNPKDEGGGWWPYCRPGTHYGRLEVRLLPALPLEVLYEVLKHLEDFFTLLLSIAPDRPMELGQLRGSNQWKLITGFPIGRSKIPFEYNRSMRRQDIHGIA